MIVRRYIDRFDDNQITKPLQTSVGNGTIVESGTTIVLTAAAGVDCQWDAGVANAPVAYNENASVFPDGVLDPNEYGEIGFMRWELRITSATFTPVDDVPRAGLTLWHGYQNAYQLAYDFSSEYIVFERMVGDVKTAIADTGGNTGSPDTTPKRLCVVFNPRNRSVYAYGQEVGSKEIAAFHSSDDGLSWSYIGKEAVALDEATFGVGVFLKRSVVSPTSTASATFDYLEYGEWYVTKEDYETAVFEDRLVIPTAGGVNKHSDSYARGVGQAMPGPSDQPVDRPTGPSDQAAWEDQHPEFPNAGGPSQHQAPAMPPGHLWPLPEDNRFSTGQVLPASPEEHPEAPERTFDTTAWEDTLIFPVSTGLTHPFVASGVGVIVTGDGPEQPDGGASRVRQAAWEDRLSFQLGGPPMDYPATVQDGDGNEFIAGYQARFITLYDPSTDAWGSARSPGDGFYGADRSGTLYYDGTATGFGNFGTVAGGLRDTAWADCNNGPVDHEDSPSYTTSIPVDGTVRVQATLSPTDEGSYVSSGLRWYIEGDFDVEVEWLDYAMTGGTDGGASLECGVDFGHYTYVRRRTPGSDRVDSDCKLNNSWINYASAATSVVTGKFRITRTGSTIRRYYDIGGGWVQIGADQTFGTERVWVRCGFWVGGTATVADVKFRNLIVNVGTTSNKIGWAREAFGSHRGNRDDFPTHAIVVATDTSVDIIDVDNHLLWMRLLTGDNNILDTFGAANMRPRRVKMKNGVLLIGLGNDNDQGGLIRVDFNLDCVNIHRTDGSTITGANYKSGHGATQIGVQNAAGALRSRNAASDWSGDYATWKQHAESTRGGDLWFDSGYEYRASANEGGVAVFKWHRWYLYGSTPLEALTNIQWAHDNTGNRMYWCFFREATGELMYMDDTRVYSVFKTTYESRLAGGFAGIFSADQSKVLPGTRTYNVQKLLVPYSTGRFYLPADEGVYQVEWPTGSFIHQFGHAGSGAAYELIPSGAIVRDISVANDGGTPILVLVLYFKDTGTDRLMGINIIGNTVHSYTPLTTGNMQFAESAA